MGNGIGCKGNDFTVFKLKVMKKCFKDWIIVGLPNDIPIGIAITTDNCTMSVGAKIQNHNQALNIFVPCLQENQLLEGWEDFFCLFII